MPLGVWLLYFFCKNNKDRWQKYRLYAWLGFGANYLLLAAALLSIPLQSVIYPNDKLSTHIGSISNASLISIHPSAGEVNLDMDALKQRLSTMELTIMDTSQWYYHPVNKEEEMIVKEKFPYLLVDVKSKWGSGIRSVVYVEEDGRGLLISMPKQQYYYRSEASLFEGGERSEIELTCGR